MGLEGTRSIQHRKRSLDALCWVSGPTMLQPFKSSIFVMQSSQEPSLDYSLPLRLGAWKREKMESVNDRHNSRERQRVLICGLL